MTKPRTKTFEELTAEIEDGKKKIRQFENREKLLRQKLSQEERRTRSHRLIVRGAVFESIVPEAKNMTDEEATALLRLCLLYTSFFNHSSTETFRDKLLKLVLADSSRLSASDGQEPVSYTHLELWGGTV